MRRSRGVALGLMLGIATLAGPSVAWAIPGICEGLDELDPVERQDLADTVRRASVFPEVGLLFSGGLRGPDPVRGVSRAELSLGVTRAVTRDLDRICERGHLPGGIGIHGLLAWDRYREAEAGAFLRYYNQLNHGALVPVWEAGATTTLAHPDVIEGRVGFGLGNPMIQAMIHLASDGDIHRVEVGIRLDLAVLRMVSGI